MPDLILRDFIDLSDKNSVQVLSDEKVKMLGIKKTHAVERAGNRSFSSLFGVSSAKNTEAGASRQAFRSCQVSKERRGDAGT
jgi:hypothetical protein